MGTVHIIGAGVAGLACAVRCALGGQTVALYETAPQAGGRARSFDDEGLGCLIDNGNHLVLSGNGSVRAFLGDTGGSRQLTEIAPASFPFIEPASQLRWRLRPGWGPLPLWLLSSRRRVPGSQLGDYRDIVALARAKPSDTVATCVDTGSVLFERLWQPLARAILNTDAREGSAQLLWKALSLTIAKGEAACRPLVFSRGLSAALVTPALKTIREHGGMVRYQARLRGIRWQDDRVLALRFSEGLLRVDDSDAVVLAVPPDACEELWPAAEPPLETRPIVNVHYRLGEPVTLPGGQTFLGLIGTQTHWLFQRDNVLSITISAATEHVERANWDLANSLWGEISQVLGRNMGRLPPWRVVKERRATIAQTPSVVASRPGAETLLGNLFLAGDWTDTGLPATIDGAARSGHVAARLALASMANNKSSR
jgi:squalene-associated FAD-dependent desaturase